MQILSLFDKQSEILALLYIGTSCHMKLNQTCSATAGGSFTTQSHRWDQLASKYVSAAKEKHRQ